MKNYTIEQVISAASQREFLNFPKTLYKSNRNWVCPLDSDIESRFDPERNELFADGDAIRWIVRDQKNKVVGRIAAFYNRELARAGAQDEGYPVAGGCGFFESINDQQVANMLFDNSAAWLKSKGMEAMDGPINFGDRDQWWGLLVEGFQFQPLYANNYNPPYYVELFENYGFKNYFNQHTYLRNLKVGLFSDSVYEKVKRLNENDDYQFRSINLSDLEQVADDFRFIYNKAWAMFTGVKPIDREHAQGIMNKIKPILDPKLMIFAYYKDEPIGFFISLPDLNRVIGGFNGKMSKFNILRLIYLMKIRRKADRVFGLIFGVMPEFHGKGIEAGMIYEFENKIKYKEINYKTLELAWIGDFNPVMMRMVENYVCASKHKMHTTYRFMFNPEQKFLRAPRMGVKRSNS